MKITYNQSLLMLALLALPLSARAAAPALKVGDPAPKMQPGRWIQGEPVNNFEKGKAYIVEFWATWCGPCRVSIPHLNEIHTRFKDKGLIVVGQDCWENDDNLAAPFVKKMGDKMTYRVALDSKPADAPKGKMAETWMSAADQDGIPTAFVIDPKGILAWVGHPMNLSDELIAGVLDGTHDLKKAAAEFDAARKEKLQREAAQAPIRKVYEAIGKRDWDQADAELAGAEKTLPKDTVDALRGEILLAKRDYSGLEALGEKCLRDHGTTTRQSAAMRLNEWAWRMALDEQISNADLKRADKLARWADDAFAHQNSAILDTLARVQFRLDNHTEAIGLQEKAVRLADENMKPELEQTLESYRKGQLPKAK